MAAVSVALASCEGTGSSRREGEEEPRLASVPLPVRAQTEGTLFVRLTPKETGIEFMHTWDPPEKLSELITSQMSGGGMAIGDYDNDGRPDVYLTRPQGGGRLYRNLGGFRFEDSTEASGVRTDDIWCLGASFADIDNDGDLDLHVGAYDAPNQLFINRGNGKFTEEAKSRGLAFHGASTMMAFADYDLDGDLDGYLLTNRLHSPENMKPFYRVESDGTLIFPQRFREYFDIMIKPDGKVKEIGAGQFDRLYRNDGSGRFVDVTGEAGIRGNHYGLGIVWWDYNRDGLPDLYVSNDFWGPDHLYRNNGDGSFTDVAPELLPHTPWFSMGVDAADIDNDGLPDLLATDMAATTHFKDKVMMGEMGENGWFLEYGRPRQAMKNALFHNTGAGRFREMAELTGLARTDWTWAVRFADLDEDGLVDLFVSNGMTRFWFDSDLRPKYGDRWDEEAQQIWLGSPKQEETNFAFRNAGDLKFEEVGKAWGLDHRGVSFGSAMGDLDGDGDLDLVVNNFESEPGVYRNEASGTRRVKIALRGKRSNRYGYGAEVTVKAGELNQTRCLTAVRGFMGSHEPVLFFGLGREERIERLSVSWPSGHRQSFSNLEVDRSYVITEPNGTPPSRSTPVRSDPMFAAAIPFEGAGNKETAHDDFARQPLLPNKYSQLGPGMAWGDVDGDGDSDFLLGQPAGQPTQLFRNLTGGRFERVRQSVFSADAACEDMAPLFFDADSDGDLDLYIVSGSYEFPKGDPALADRLYLNDGSGQFGRAPSGALPNLRDCGGPVCAADFDRDDDLDLFVGGRLIPGEYPLAPRSRLLINESEPGGAVRFVDRTEELAPELSEVGMVTGALWSDANGDGLIDLLVALEWGPVKFFRNEGGTFSERTEEAGLAMRLGWWNGIAGRDLDNDGDIDYVVTNFGLNTKYKAQPGKPVVAYYGAFGEGGDKHFVEAKYEGDMLLPIRGRSCSSAAMPHLGEKFKTFRSFARASLPDIYESEALSGSKQYRINHLRSGVLLNDGKACFEFKSLGRLAQVSPAFGCSILEIDGDRSPDLYLAQNFFGPQPETGRMDGGVSLLQTGMGEGAFLPVATENSGLLVPGDAKSVTAPDLDGDYVPDLVVGVNSGPVRCFLNRVKGGRRGLQVVLRGKPGNPTAAGSRVTLIHADGVRQTAELYAGGGYLSQDPPEIYFGLGKSAPVKLEIRWADGHMETRPISEDILKRRRLEIERM